MRGRNDGGYYEAVLNNYPISSRTLYVRLHAARMQYVFIVLFAAGLTRGKAEGNCNPASISFVRRKIKALPQNQVATP